MANVKRAKKSKVKQLDPLNFREQGTIDLNGITFLKKEPGLSIIAFVTTKSNKSDKKSSKKDKESSVIQCHGAPSHVAKWIKSREQDHQITGSFKEATFFRLFDGQSNLLIVGLGTEESLTHERLRQASGHAIKTLTSQRILKIAILSDTTLPYFKTREQAINALTEGCVLASYHYDFLKSKIKSKIE